MHKAGFVNIVGNPNVGKSTLMNQLVGERISIATFKAQTTRHRIMGIVNTDDMQMHCKMPMCCCMSPMWLKIRRRTWTSWRRCRR